jgi:hypothetical protein
MLFRSFLILHDRLLRLAVPLFPPLIRDYTVKIGDPGHPSPETSHLGQKLVDRHFTIESGSQNDPAGTGDLHQASVFPGLIFFVYFLSSRERKYTNNLY